MKRTFATLGAVGLAAFVVTAPASAAGGITVCHYGNGGYHPISIPGQGLQGHDLHDQDIIPPNKDLEAGQNWAAGSSTHANGCVALPVTPPVVTPPVTPPVVTPPVVVDPPAEEDAVNPPVVEPVVETPVVEAPAVTPVVETPAVEAPAVVEQVPAAAVAVPAQPSAAQRQSPAPARAASAVPATAPAATSQGTNRGYNAQTAVGSTGTSPTWLAGVGALAAAGTAVALRRRSRSLPAAG